MLERIQEIKGIKRFYDVNNINFGSSKIIIFFGENGSGKTTLSKLLKALHDRDIEQVSSLKHDEGRFIKANLIFNDGGCVDCIINDNVKRINGEFPTTLEVFNIDFINNYVYLGHEVTADQKSNLYKFIFGEHQVQLQQEIDEILEKIKELNTKIQEKQAELIKLAHIPKEEIENFVRMDVKESIQDLENRITQLNIKLKNLQENEYIHKLGTLEPISTKDAEELVSNIKSVCMTSLENLHITALKRFEEHIHVLGKDKREWLREGFQMLKNKNLDICPFCGQDIKTNELIREYETAFNKEYINFVLRIDDLSKQINRLSFSYMVETVNKNDELVQKWSKYIQHLEIPNLEDLQNVERNMKDALINLLENKRQNIFIPLDNFSEIDLLLQGLKEKIELYNDKVKEINKQIDEFKLSVSKDDAKQINDQIRDLELKRKRKQFSSLCQEYAKLTSQKEKLQQKKKELTDELNSEMDKFLNRYEETINSIFEKFNTDYRIKSEEIKTTSKRRVFEYGLQLNFSEDIKPNKKLGEILSEGDKTTLAFSVFIAKLILDDKLDERLIIIDDPVSSLDEFRILRTVDYIIRFAHKAKQVVILTHNPVFAKELLYRIKKEQLNANFYHIDRFRYKDRSVVNEMSLSESEYFIEQKLNHYYVKFINIKNLIDRWNRSEEISSDEIDKAFDDGREVFEHYLRIKFPNDLFTPIGEVIKRIDDGDKKIFLNELYNALSKDPHSNTVKLTSQDKISRLMELINFIQFDKYN